MRATSADRRARVRWGPWLALVAAGVALTVALVTSAPSPDAPPGGGLEPDAVPGAQAAGSAMTAAGEAGAEPSRDGRTLQVEAHDAHTGEPIAGARIVLLASTPQAASTGLHDRDAARAQGVTDDRGRWTGPWPDEPGLRVIARAPRYRPVGVAAAAVVRLALEPGGTVHGRAVDGTGAPVAGVEIAIAHARRPRDARAASPGEPGRGHEATRSAEDGTFLFSGLEPGPHRLAVRSDDWRGVRVLRSRARLVGTSGGLAVRTGDIVDLVLAPVRLLHLRLVRDATGTPASATTFDVRVRPEGHRAVTAVTAQSESATWERPGGAPALALLSRAAPAGVVLVRVDLDADGPPAASARCEIDVPGYVPIALPVPLTRPARLAAGEAPFVVRLVPEVPGETGTLHVTSDPVEPTLYRPDLRYLSVCRPEDGTEAHLRGTRLDAERWAFAGVPAGRIEARLHDGIVTSDVVALDVEAGGVTEARIAMPPPRGVVLQLFDPVGRRLFDADAVLFLRPDQVRGAVDASAITRLRPGPGGPRDVVHPLAPGTWHYLVDKRGHELARGRFVLPEVGWRRVRVELTEEAR